ncbi:MAG TPA: hypothetical protein VHF06_24500, partial [Pseudonocardiaceae bacterium]|nr:hypothetical protein [Pseudonocardiaceae bacterium]
MTANRWPMYTRHGGAADGAQPDTGGHVHRGSLGTALLPDDLPGVPLIDELDKADIDLPNDLLNSIEEGEFRILELTVGEGLCALGC